MQGSPATYLGKIVSKEHFRVFIYSATGQSKLVESWDEYEKHMASGLWFPTREEIKAKEEEPEEKPKAKRSRKVVVKQDEPIELQDVQPSNVEILESSVELVEEPVQEESFSHEDLAFEVTPQSDDFLSDAGK